MAEYLRLKMTPIDNEIAPPGGGRKPKYYWASMRVGTCWTFHPMWRNAIISSAKFYRQKSNPKFRIVTRVREGLFLDVTRVPFNYQPRKAKKR